MKEDRHEIERKLRILQHATESGVVRKTCRYFGIGRASFYRWQAAYRKLGDNDLINRNPEEANQQVRAKSKSDLSQPLKPGS